MEQPQAVDTTTTKKPRKIHPGRALGIIPKPTPHPNKKTRRYHKGDLDVDSAVAFLTHLRQTDDMPVDILRVRGRLRSGFPGFGVTKKLIQVAYAKAGWDYEELNLTTKKEKKAASRELREQLAGKNLIKAIYKPFT